LIALIIEIQRPLGGSLLQAPDPARRRRQADTIVCPSADDRTSASSSATGLQRPVILTRHVHRTTVRSNAAGPTGSDRQAGSLQPFILPPTRTDLSVDPSDMPSLHDDKRTSGPASQGIARPQNRSS